MNQKPTPLSNDIRELLLRHDRVNYQGEPTGPWFEFTYARNRSSQAAFQIVSLREGAPPHALMISMDAIGPLRRALDLFEARFAAEQEEATRRPGTPRGKTTP